MQVYTTAKKITTSESLEGRKRWKEQLVGEHGGGPLGFQNRAIRRFGAAAGIFARQLLFWDDLGALDNGWTWKSRAQMESETGLSRREQERARRELGKAGVLEEAVRPVGLLKTPTTHYRLDLERLAELLDELEQDAEQERPATRTTGSKYQDDGVPVPGRRGPDHNNKVRTETTPVKNLQETYETKEKRGASAPAFASASAPHNRRLKDEELRDGDAAPDNGTGEAAQLRRMAEMIADKIDAEVRAKWGRALPDDRRECLQREVMVLAPAVRTEVPNRDERVWVWQRVVGQVPERWAFGEALGATISLRDHVEAAKGELADRRNQERDRERCKVEEEEQLVQRCLEKLRGTFERWPWSDEKTARWLRRCREQFPLADPLEVCGDLAAFYIDAPGEKPSLKKLHAFFQTGHEYTEKSNGSGGDTSLPGDTKHIPPRRHY